MANTILPKPIDLKELGLFEPELLPRSHQQEFDDQYITAKEIEERVAITRAAIIRKMNRLFPAIKVAGTSFWKRTPELEKFVSEWSDQVRTRNEL